MDKFFKITERGSSVRTEITAGITTFMTMAYILAVNPMILSQAGMDFGKVFAATAIVSAGATLIMGLFANLPFALSSGMGLNAFFAYTVCLGMGYPWQWALSAILVEGIIFLLMTFCNIREAIVNSIPAGLKKAISAGIGLFIAYIGLKNAEIITGDASTLTKLNPLWFLGSAGVAVLGLVISGILLARKVNGAILIGIIVTTLIGIPLGVTHYAGGSFLPSAPYFCEFAFGDIFSGSRSVFDFITVVFTFLFVDMFDTVGTFIGCADKSGLVRDDGSIPNCKEGLLADAIGTTAGSIFGTSTVTTFVESAAGVAAGGRTGLTSVTTAVLFLLSLFLEPLFGSIPTAASSQALILVGAMMISSVTEIDFSDPSEYIPAFLAIVFMICASSVSDGIMFGILSYVILNYAAGKKDKVPPAIIIVALLFAAKIIITAI